MLSATLDVVAVVQPLVPVDLSGHFGLAGPTPRPLARHDRSLQEKLPAPDAPRLPALDGAGQARGPRRATAAERFGALHVLRRFGEEQFRIFGGGQVTPIELEPPGLRQTRRHSLCIRAGGGIGPLHRSQPLSCIPRLAISRPSEGTVAQKTVRPRTLCGSAALRSSAGSQAGGCSLKGCEPDPPTP